MEVLRTTIHLARMRLNHTHTQADRTCKRSAATWNDGGVLVGGGAQVGGRSVVRVCACAEAGGNEWAVCAGKDGVALVSQELSAARVGFILTAAQVCGV